MNATLELDVAQYVENIRKLIADIERVGSLLLVLQEKGIVIDEENCNTNLLSKESLKEVYTMAYFFDQIQDDILSSLSKRGDEKEDLFIFAGEIFGDMLKEIIVFIMQRQDTEAYNEELLKAEATS